MAKITDPDNLTYSVNSATNMLRFDTAAKTIQLVAGGALVAADGVTGQCLFSKIKEVIKADATLIKYALPVREMIHDESMELINGAKRAGVDVLYLGSDAHAPGQVGYDFETAAHLVPQVMGGCDD